MAFHSFSPGNGNRKLTARHRYVQADGVSSPLSPSLLVVKMSLFFFFFLLMSFLFSSCFTGQGDGNNVIKATMALQLFLNTWSHLHSPAIN